MLLGLGLSILVKKKSICGWHLSCGNISYVVLMNVDIHYAYGVLRFINTFYQYHKKTNFILNNSKKILVDLHWITLSKKCYPSNAAENDLGNHSSPSVCQWYEERSWKAIPFINFKVEIEIWFAYNQHHLGSDGK